MTARERLEDAPYNDIPNFLRRQPPAEPTDPVRAVAAEPAALRRERLDDDTAAAEPGRNLDGDVIVVAELPPMRPRQRRQSIKTEPKPTTVVMTEPDPVIYDQAVAEAKQIIADLESSRSPLMRLGELADQVIIVYGEGRLKRFADDIGMVACTLERCRSVFRAWRTKEAPAPVLSYSVAQELQAHPQRFELIKKKPDMTKREARSIMRRFRKEQLSAADHLLAEQERWWRAVLLHASKVLQDAAVADGEISPALRQMLREVVQPLLLPNLREAGEALIKLAAFLKEIANDEPGEQLPVIPRERLTDPPEPAAEAAE